jgi:hypothetical protein
MPSSYRGFTIPGNGCTEWDDEIHGKEVIDADDPRAGSGDFGVVDWKPGYYTFSIGSCGASLDFSVPEPSFQPHPQQCVLRGIHEFLKVAHDEPQMGLALHG